LMTVIMVHVTNLTSGVANPTGRARFAETSTVEEWRARGASLLSTHRNFEAAATCFRNAGDVAGWLSATAEARRARANAAGSASAAADDLDAAARCYLMHAAAVDAPANGGAGGGGGGGGGSGGSAAEICGALVKAAHCLHRLRRYADAAAALELVGCRSAAAACHLAAAAAANVDDAEEKKAAGSIDWTEVQRVARVAATR